MLYINKFQFQNFYILFLLFILILCQYSQSELYLISRKEQLQEFDKLNMNDLNILKCKNSIYATKINQIILFLLSRDRLYAVFYSLKYWLKLVKRNNLIIIVLDHNTTYKPLLRYYDYLLKYNKIEVYYLKQIEWKNAVDKEIPSVIKFYLQKYMNAKYYILSDIDIILINIPSDILDFYGTLLNNCDINVIGPSLMVNDISSKFPHYKKVYKWENQYYHTNHYDVLYKNMYFTLVRADIDTIFGMRKRSTVFKRHSRKSFRSLSPYIAHHIDWYISSLVVPESFFYYVNHSSNVNHSGSAFNISNSKSQP